MVKPSTGGGSRGVARCFSIEAVLDHLKQHDLRKAIVEEYVDGQEYGGDFLVAGGELLFEVCTLKGGESAPGAKTSPDVTKSPKYP